MKPVQLMPLPDNIGMERGIAAASRDGSRNDAWFTVGAVLMDDGTVEPLVWNGWFGFQVGNPLQQDRVHRAK